MHYRIINKKLLLDKNNNNKKKNWKDKEINQSLDFSGIEYKISN